MSINIFNNKKSQKVLGLRIEAKTFDGVKEGIPAIANLLSEHGFSGTFFFPIGKDNSGRNAFRLLHPYYAYRFIKENIFRKKGIKTLGRGFLWKGPDIGSKLNATMKSVKNSGHEIGLLSLDPYRWQIGISKFSKATTEHEITSSMEKWNKLFGSLPDSMGNPGWQISAHFLDYFENDYAHKIKYRSDCLGSEVGYPQIGEKVYSTLEIPTTLPLLSDSMNRHGVNEYNYNRFILDKIMPNTLNVMTIKAEDEGMVHYNLFQDFIIKCKLFHIQVVPLIEIHDKYKKNAKPQKVRTKKIKGRPQRISYMGSFKKNSKVK